MDSKHSIKRSANKLGARYGPDGLKSARHTIYKYLDKITTESRPIAFKLFICFVHMHKHKFGQMQPQCDRF